MLIETGRHPLAMSVQLQSIKYFLRLPTIKLGRLMRNYYETEKQRVINNDKFITFIITTGLSTFQVQNPGDYPGDLVENPGYFNLCEKS